MHVQDQFITVKQLSRGTAQGLFDCLTSALECMKITGWEKKMIGFGCDGCNANMGERG